MNNLVRSAIVILALLASASTSMARPRDNSSSFDRNSSEDARSFWDNQQRSGS